MTPPIPDAGSTAAPEPVELPPHAAARLRAAGGWARFIAIATFVLTGLAGLASVAVLVAQTGQTAAYQVGRLVPVVFGLLLGAGAASLAWRYGQDIRAFLAQGAPVLPQAFRSLRQLVILWTIVVALSTAWQLVSVLAKFF